jgi:hypothetical protein
MEDLEEEQEERRLAKVRTAKGALSRTIELTK